MPREVIDVLSLERSRLGWTGGSAQPDLVQDVSSHWRDVGLDDL